MTKKLPEFVCASIQPERNKRWQRQTKTTQGMFGLTRRRRGSVGEGMKNWHIKDQVPGASLVVVIWHWSRRKGANPCLHPWNYDRYIPMKTFFLTSHNSNTEPLCSGGDNPPRAAPVQPWMNTNFPDSPWALSWAYAVRMAATSFLCLLRSFCLFLPVK